MTLKKVLRRRFVTAMVLLSAMLTLVLLVALTSGSPGGSITISGKLEYENELGGLSPMRRVKVYLMDNDTWEGAAGDEVVAWQYTDDSGNFEFIVDNEDGFGQDGRDPYVIVESSNPAAIAMMPWGGAYTMLLPEAGKEVWDGFSWNYGTLHPDENNAAWQAIDAVLSARDWIFSQVGWERPTKVTIYWPSGDWPRSYGDTIHLPFRSLWDWDHVRVHHEYGMSVLYTLYGNTFPVGYLGPVPPHHVYFESSGVFALVEGWASFMQCAVDDDPDNLVDWNGGHGGNIETNDWYNSVDEGDMDGAIIEGSVASILWDIMDGSPDDDPLSLGFDEIFYIMRDYKPTDMHSFWDWWVFRYPLPLYEGDLSTIYWMYGIDKDFYPPTGTISINSGDIYTTSTSVTLTVSAYDYGSGVKAMRFSNFPDAWFWGIFFPWVWSDWYPYDTSAPWTLAPGDGIKTVYAQFMDNKGLMTSVFSLPADTIILDTVPPTGSIVINAGDTYTTSTSVTLYLTYFDATSGVDVVRYSNDGVWDTEPWESPSSTKAWSLTPVDGVRTVYYQIRDKAGLVSNTYIDTIVLDTVPPTGSIVINGDDTYTTWPLVTLTLTYSDATSGVDVVRYMNDGEAWWPWEAPSDVRLWLLRLVDGTRTVYYQIRDKAGLVSQFSDTIFYDSTPPITTIHHSAGTAWLTYFDPAPGSGVKDTYYRIDGGTWIPYTGSFSVPGTGGTRKIEAYSLDNAGNTESPKILNVHYLTISASPAGVWTPPWGTGWYSEGTTASVPTAPSSRLITGYSPWGYPKATYYTFSTWKKDLVDVSGNPPSSVLMDAPHWVTAAYFGCEVQTVSYNFGASPPYVVLNLRITTGTAQYVKVYYTMTGPDLYQKVDVFLVQFPGGLDYIYGPMTVNLPESAPVGTYRLTMYAEDPTTGTVISYSWFEVEYA